MANHTMPVIDRTTGQLIPLPSGDTPTDAGGNAITGSSTNETYTNLDCSTNPNYPAADKGDHVIVSVAGKIGGASGVAVEAGDMAVCTTDSTAAGDHATVGSYWVIVNKNIADTAAAIRKVYTFTVDGFLDGQNQLSGVAIMTVVCPVSGYIIAAGVNTKSARTAGSIALEPHVNGVGLTPTDLDLLLDDSPTQKQSATVAHGTSGYSVTAGDTIGFLITTTSYAPLANKLSMVLVVEG